MADTQAVVTDVAVHDADDHHDSHELPAAMLPRRRNVQIGTAFGTGAMLMYFAGLFGIYLAERTSHNAIQRAASDNPADWAAWFPRSARVELTAPTIMTWTLLMSVVTMQWAVYSFKRNDRRHGLMAVAVQIILGVAVINQTVFQWNQLSLAADDASTNAAPLIWAITASFVAALVVELVFLAIMAFRALSGASISHNVDGMASAAVVWYALVAVYFIIWILVFITK